MKASKAIEILTQLSEPGIAVWDPDDIDACKLGIEALKAYSYFRSLYLPGICPKLPGETEETPSDTSFRHSAANHHFKGSN